LIDRYALRRSLHGRRRESAVVEVPLKWISGLIAERNPGQPAIYRIKEGGRILVVKIT
jgi:hypothetical protein